MKKTIIVLFSAVLILSCKNKSHTTKKEPTNSHELVWLENWFSAWELMSKQVLKLPKSTPPTMLFYDDMYVYTTSKISAPNGVFFDGPKLLGEKLPWRKELHNDTLTIPDGQRIPIQLMTFAAPSKQKDVEAFFVMAAPVFWKGVGIESKEVGLEKLLTGVFLHEFSHTRQMNGMGSKITDFDNNNTFNVEVSDDIIQDYFAKNNLYVTDYKNELSILYAAAFTKKKSELYALTRKGLRLFREKQLKYIRPTNEVLIDMENIFLSMEGLGQFMIVSWLTNPDGGNIPFDIAVKATRRNKKWWSQDEGLALFLILDKLATPDWKMMFSDNPIDVITLIEKELKTKH